MVYYNYNKLYILKVIRKSKVKEILAIICYIITWFPTELSVLAYMVAANSVTLANNKIISYPLFDN